MIEYFYTLKHTTMNRDLLREIRIKLEAINSNIPNVSNTTGIEAKLDELIETTKEQNKIFEQMLKTLETLYCKKSINSVSSLYPFI